MSSDTELFAKAIFGFIAGFLISSGYLPLANKDVFVTDAATLAGLVLALISFIYTIEHSFLKVKDDLQYTTEVETPATPTTVTPDPITETPAPPVA